MRDRYDIEDRFEELARLKDGWYDGEGKRPSAASLAQAREIIDDLMNPSIFATVDGGVHIDLDVADIVVYSDGSVDVIQ